MHSLSISQIHYKFSVYFAFFSRNMLSIFWIHLKSNFDSANSLFISRKYDEFTIYFAISLWLYHLYRGFTNSWIYYEFTMYLLLFADSLWINFQFRENYMNFLPFARNHYESTSYFAINNEFTIYFTTNLPFFSNNYYKLTMQSVGVMYFEFTIYCTNSLLICFVFRKSTMDLLSTLKIICVIYSRIYQ